MAKSEMPRIYADFNNADAKGRLRLNTVGTVNDLARQQVQLRHGLLLQLYADDTDGAGNPDDLQVVGVVEFSTEENCWAAVIDWDAIGHTSDERGSRVSPRAAS